jgi:hypothetical protein
VAITNAERMMIAENVTTHVDPDSGSSVGTAEIEFAS